jgi:hypothetical protein
MTFSLSRVFVQVLVIIESKVDMLKNSYNFILDFVDLHCVISPLVRSKRLSIIARVTLIIANICIGTW